MVLSVLKGLSWMFLLAKAFKRQVSLGSPLRADCSVGCPGFLFGCYLQHAEGLLSERVVGQN